MVSGLILKAGSYRLIALRWIGFKCSMIVLNRSSHPISIHPSFGFSVPCFSFSLHLFLLVFSFVLWINIQNMMILFYYLGLFEICAKHIFNDYDWLVLVIGQLVCIGRTNLGKLYFSTFLEMKSMTILCSNSLFASLLVSLSCSPLPFSLWRREARGFVVRTCLST